MKTQSLYLIDYSNWASRLTSTYKWSKSDIDGVVYNTSIMAGFADTFRSIPYTDIVIAIGGTPKRRQSLLPAYIAKRHHLNKGITTFPDMLSTLQFIVACGKQFDKNIRIVAVPNQESDEVISSIVHAFTHKLPTNATFIDSVVNKDFTTDPAFDYLTDFATGSAQHLAHNYDELIIASSDPDLAQLCRYPNIRVDMSTNCSKLRNAMTLTSLHGVLPLSSILFRALYAYTGEDTWETILPHRVIPKDDVVTLINKHVLNDDDLITFYNACTHRIPYTMPNPLERIAFFIHDTRRAYFTRNFNMVYQTWQCHPVFIDLKNIPDVDAIATKWGVRVGNRNFV